MKTKLTLAILASALLCGCDAPQPEVLLRTAKERGHIPAPKHQEMPPGYLLQKSDDGKFRAARSYGMPLLDISQDNTRQHAIDRAWEQYDYENIDDKTGWSNVAGKEEAK